MIPEINDRLLIHLGMFVSALVIASAIGVMASTTIVGMMRVPEVTAQPVLQPKPPGKLQDRHPSMLKSDTLTAADRAIVAPPSHTPPNGQGRLVVSQKPVTAAVPYADPYADLDDPPATFVERWDALKGDPLPVTPVRPIKYEKKPAPTPTDWGDEKIIPPPATQSMRVVESEQEIVTGNNKSWRGNNNSSHRGESRRKSRGDDLCSRHGMRQVWSGRYRWRCRR